jgi:hypothetical protein
MEKNTELTIQETAQLVYDLMYGKQQKNILQAYSTVYAKYKTDYSYDEIKDYLFHHEMKRSVE